MLYKIKKSKDRLHITTLGNPHRFYINLAGNKKVRFPIVTFQSASNCVNKGWCPYSVYRSIEKGKPKDGYPVCYAQKIEKIRPNVRKARDENELFIHWLYHNYSVSVLQAFGELLMENILLHNKSIDHIRINESGDVDGVNSIVINAMESWLNTYAGDNGVDANAKLYLYTKSPKIKEQFSIETSKHVTVIESDIDFVAIKDTTGKELVCPGECGPCKLCPLFTKGQPSIYVKEH